MRLLRLFLAILAPLCGSLTAAPIENAVLIVSDDLRADALGCYGNQVCQTPNLDRLAAQGMVFERAYCQGTVCAPSRASFTRGRYYGTTGITLGEHFIAEAGGFEELFDMDADPGQHTNLAKDAALTATLPGLRRRLEARLDASPPAGKRKGKAPKPPREPRS